MSAGREVAGQKATSGRKRELAAHQNWLTKEEQEIMRRGTHDFLAAHGEKVRRMEKPRFGGRHDAAAGTRRQREARKARRASPGTWQAKFLRSLVRTGDLRRAADLSRCSYPTVRSNICRDLLFREQCADALSEHAGRMLKRCARGGGRWELNRRSARALMRHFERAMRQLSTAADEGARGDAATEMEGA